MFAVSVIICSHNPREEYLRRVLDALKAQTLSVKDWELLLVDNASETPLAGRADLSWHPHARHVREEKLGLTHARLRGITESRGNLLVFVDDDNVLRADYLQASLKIGADWPWLGAWNGSCIPEYETEPPAELQPYLWGLLTEKLTTSLWAKLPHGGLALPTGAGMAVRRAVAEQYRELTLRDPLRQALDRSGKNLGAGGDSDMALSGYKLGLGAGRFPELELTHLIPARRLTLEYLEKLFEGFGYGGIILTAIHAEERWMPGRFGSSALKIYLLQISMFAARKSRAERVIKLAEERGRLAARRDLERLNAAKSL
jgi:glycosyltransferase involved in cell wall biosynthesis